MIELPKLPYARDALAPHVSEKTLDFHYGKHHKGYVDNLNKLIAGTEFENTALEDIVEKSNSGAIFNNAAQVMNHTFLWESMTPLKYHHELDEDSSLAKAIIKKFGSIDEFKDEFKDKATKIFGSGWCWLTRDDEYVTIEVTRNAGRPGNRPLFVCDVWEHAYYLDYQNDRGKYVDGFFEVLNWEFAEKNWKSA